MACYTLPTPLAINKNIGEPCFCRSHTVIIAHTFSADISEVTVHARMQVRQLIVAIGRVRGTGQHRGAVDECAAKSAPSNSAARMHPRAARSVLLDSSQPRVFDLHQSRFIFPLTGWANCTLRGRAQQQQRQQRENSFHGRSYSLVVITQPPTILTPRAAER